MRRISQKNTKPEMRVRRALHADGLRFRIHRRDLPGSPDVVLPRHGAVVFVHGCFWHRHVGCRRSTTPKTRCDFWNAKFRANMERDARAEIALRDLGWRVFVVWECESGRPETFSALTTAIREGVPLQPPAEAARSCEEIEGAAEE